MIHSPLDATVGCRKSPSSLSRPLSARSWPRSAAIRDRHGDHVRATALLARHRFLSASDGEGQAREPALPTRHLGLRRRPCISFLCRPALASASACAWVVAKAAKSRPDDGPLASCLLAWGLEVMRCTYSFLRVVGTPRMVLPFFLHASLPPNRRSRRFRTRW
jgi:hypothetical protein